MKELVINSTAQHTLLLLVPLIIAALLRLGKIRGSSILGGVFGGILLGPAVFGSVYPTYWEDIFQGGLEEHKLVQEIEQPEERAQAIATWEVAKWKDQRTLRTYLIALVSVVLLSGSMRKTLTAKSNTATSLTVGIWASIIPGGIITVASHYWWGTSIAGSLAIGACLAAGPWTFTRWEQQVANDHEGGSASLMLRCGYVAWIVASIVAFYSAWTVQGAMSLVWLLPLLFLPLFWILPNKNLPWLTWFADNAAIPSIAATVMVLIHPLDALTIWPIVLVTLISSDGRWLGGMIGLLILGGRKSVDAMRVTMPLVDAGVSQMCMAALLFGVGVLNEKLAFAAIIGAICIEFTAKTRQKFSASIGDKDLFHRD